MRSIIYLIGLVVVVFFVLRFLNIVQEMPEQVIDEPAAIYSVITFIMKGGFNVRRLSAPKVVVFWIAVILAAIGFLSYLGIIPIDASTGFWALVIGFVLLALGNLLRDF